jgi:hypothetical protein
LEHTRSANKIRHYSVHFVYVLTLLLVISGNIVHAQSYLLKQLQSFKQGELFGLKNKVSGSVIVAAKYDSINMLCDSVPLVWVKGKVGCVTSLGGEIIPCNFTKIAFNKTFTELLLVCKDSLYGVYSIYGKEIAACKYNEITISKNGIVIKSNDKKGVLDRNGNLIVPCEYDAIFDFYDSLALVKKNSKYGFVSLRGIEVIPCEYDKIFWNKKKYNYFPGGKALVQKNGKFGIIDRSGAVIVPCQYDWEFYLPLFSNYSRVIQNEKKGLIDKTGKQVLPCIYDEISWENDSAKNASDPSGTHGKQFFIVKSNKKWGIVNNENSIIIPIKYDGIGNFSYGLAAASLNGKWGYIDQRDSVIIPFEYDYCDAFIDDLAEAGYNITDVSSGKTLYKSGLINKKGKTILPFEYTISHLSDENVFILSTEEGTVGIADSSGKIFVQPEYKISTFWTSWKPDGMIKVYNSDSRKYGYYSKSGKLVIPIEYDDAGFFSEGLVAMKKDQKWGYLNSQGKEVISFKYEETYTFSEGMALIKLNGLYGYIDSKGKEIIPPQYTEAGSFANGYARVMKKDYYGLIDTKGKTIIPAMQENILFNSDISSYYTEELALVQYNDLFGYYDMTGNPVIPCKFSWADFFSDEKAVVLDSAGKYRYINKKGNFAFPLKYDKAYSFYKGFAIVKIEKAYQMIDTAGKIITTFPYDEIKAYIDGPAAVRLGKLWGFIDEKGILILPLKYEKASSFRNSEAQVEIDGNICRINIKGDIIGLGTK